VIVVGFFELGQRVLALLQAGIKHRPVKRRNVIALGVHLELFEGGPRLLCFAADYLLPLATLIQPE